MRASILTALLFAGTTSTFAESSYPEYAIPKTCMGYIISGGRLFEDGLIFNGMSPGLCTQVIIRASYKDAVLDHCLIGRACAISGTFIAKIIDGRSRTFLDSVISAVAIPAVGIDSYPSLLGTTCRGQLLGIGAGYYYLNGDGGPCFGVEIWPTVSQNILAKCQENKLCAISGDVIRYSTGGAFWSRIESAKPVLND